MALYFDDGLRTKRTYKTYANAKAALEKIAGDKPVRWVIASTADGRFAPVVIGLTDSVGNSNVPFAHLGVTVVG